MVIKPLLFSAIETALKHYLSLADNLDTVLPPLAGKMVAITVQPFNETLYFHFSEDSIQLLDQVTEVPNTSLSGSIWAFGFMGLSSKPMRTIFSGQVQITGDMHAGQKFQDLFAKLDIKVEDKLARITGDTFARNISQFFQSQQTWSKESLETLRLNTSEFLQEETRDLPPADELEIFYHKIDALRTDFDRLQSRLDRLGAALNTTIIES
jgi:ubiquinone biosynthesis accessory factor UbiJ